MFFAFKRNQQLGKSKNDMGLSLIVFLQTHLIADVDFVAVVVVVVVVLLLVLMMI